LITPRAVSDAISYWALALVVAAPMPAARVAAVNMIFMEVTQEPAGQLWNRFRLWVNFFFAGAALLILARKEAGLDTFNAELLLDPFQRTLAIFKEDYRAIRAELEKINMRAEGTLPSSALRARRASIMSSAVRNMGDHAAARLRSLV
jgi:hypothetical protein